MNRHLGWVAAWAAATLASVASAATASDPVASHLPKSLEGVTFEQRLGAELPLDVELVDESGKARPLRELLHGRPTILTLNYFECPMLCTLELNGLVSALKPLALSVGKDFDILSVSFDSREGPELAAQKKAEYLRSYGRPDAGDGWRFLTGSEESVRALADSVGFRFRYDAESRQFAHAAGIVVLTGEGRASRYFFGVEFAPRDLKLALVESSAGKIGSLVDRVLLFCFHYDPAESKYAIAALNFVRAGGAVTVVGLLAFVVLGNRAGSQRSGAPASGGVTHGA